jgi:hypothetical protein
MSALLPANVRVPVIAVALAIAWARPANAQTAVESFDQLSQVVRPGIMVMVTDEKGERAKGKITALSGASLELSRGPGRTVSFSADHVRSVSRVDSRLNGFLIGFAAGAVPGAYLGAGIKTYCENEAASCPAAVPIVGGLFGLIGGGIGYVIDGAIDGQTLVFARRGGAARLRVMPMFGRGAAGVGLSLRF